MRLAADHVRVRVPATSANLGPGFDSLGVALALHDVVEVRAVSAAGAVVDVVGEGAGAVPTDEEHLVVRAIREGLDHAGASQVGLRLECTNKIPHGRGLGSSAGAVVAGLLIARALVAEPEALDDDTVLALASAMEGHPDNAAPALLGGVTVAWTSEEVRAVRIPVHPDVLPVAIVPPHQLSTHRARSVLPAQVPHGDAAFQAGRAALLVEDLGVWRIPLGIVSVVGIATGVSRYCPVNEALGIDNARKGIERKLMKEARGKSELKPTPGLSQY